MSDRLAAIRNWFGAMSRSRVAFVVWVVVLTMVLVGVGFRASAKLGPGTVQARVRPALDGTTELAVPPLGAVRAETHLAPVKLRLELRELDLLAALGPDEQMGLEGIEAEVYDDLDNAIRQLVLLLLGGSAVAGAVAALMFPGRRTWSRLGAGALLGVGTMGALVGPAAIGYDPQRFEGSPEFVGPLRSAPELVQQVGSLETRFGSVASRTEVLSERIAGLYSSVVTDEIARSDGEVVLLHVSDLHLNAVGLSLARDLARNFQVDAVVDTGDITSFGFAPEASFVELLEGFDVPYYLVAGNHDSEEVRRQFAASDNVHFLDDETVDVAGLKILGVSDPTVTALRHIPEERIERTYRAQYPSTRRLVRTEEPDLLLVHSPVQAEPVLGRVPVIAAGHLHRTTLEVIDGTVMAIVGSSGATGLGNLLVDESAPYRFELLRFLDNELVAIDQIELTGDEGDFTLKRQLIGPDRDDTSAEVLEEQVDEPSLEDIGEAELEELLTSTEPSTSSTTSSTTPPDDGPGG